MGCHPCHKNAHWAQKAIVYSTLIKLLNILILMVGGGLLVGGNINGQQSGGFILTYTIIDFLQVMGRWAYIIWYNDKDKYAEPPKLKNVELASDGTVQFDLL